MQAELSPTDRFRLNAFDASVLADAFGYSRAHPIAIGVLNYNLSAEDMAYINDAIQAVESLFEDANNIGPNAYVFAWSVAEAPEPSSIALMIIGVPVWLLAIRRRPLPG